MFLQSSLRPAYIISCVAIYDFQNPKKYLLWTYDEFEQNPIYQSVELLYAKKPQITHWHVTFPFNSILR